MKVFTKFILYFLLPLIFVYGAQSQYWQRIKNIPAPYDNTYWLDICVLKSNPQYVWFSGFGGHVAHTTDGGNSWTCSTIPGGDQMEKIFFPSSMTGYCSGPQGIFKSTDAGRTWTNITPPTAQGPWGNFFLDDNTGMFLAGGCFSYQEFWKTLDGGSNWTVYRDSVPNSGLTDPLLYTDGTGIAAGSGKIWRTVDGGDHWSVMSTTGSSLWHESISKINNSILVPYAGVNCSGGGGGGGMRMTTDNGLSWNDYSVGQPMFGCCLVDNLTGWACGYNESIYKTTDGGLTWFLQNCGLDPGHMDDIEFIDANTAWVVGEGVYKLSPGTYTTSKDNLAFIETCLGTDRLDSLTVHNYTNSAVIATWNLTGSNMSDFTVIKPNIQTFNIGSCDSQVVVVRFSPGGLGMRNANLHIAIQGGPFWDIALSGNGNQLTSTVPDTLVIKAPVKCGVQSDTSIKWTATRTGEFITTVTYSSGSKDITCQTATPLKISTSGTILDFSVTPKDTGWYIGRFKVHLTPCELDTFITVKFYSVSPIISSIQKIDKSDNCRNYIKDTVVICNTGNDDLIIKNAYITDATSGFYIKGYSSGKNLPLDIPAGLCDTVFVDYSPQYPGISSSKLRIENNDVTLTHGNKNPWDIALKASLITSYLLPEDTVIDFGTVCINDTSIRKFYIYNKGNLTDYFTKPINKLAEFSVRAGSGNYPAAINASDSVICSARFHPKFAGQFLDTAFIYSGSCPDTIKVIMKGNAVVASAEVRPSLLSGIIFTSQKSYKNISIINTGSTDLTVMTLDFPNLPPNWTFSFLPALPQTIKPNDTLVFNLEFISNADTALDGNIIINAKGQCEVNLTVPVHLVSSSRSVEVHPDYVNFGNYFCSTGTYKQKIVLLNSGVIADTIQSLDIAPAGSPFALATGLNLPYIIQPNDSIEIEISFFAGNPGLSSAQLEVLSANMKGKTLNVALSGAYYFSRLMPSNKLIDFGFREKCPGPDSISFTISNQGNFTDTLNIVPEVSNSKSFSVLNIFSVLIPGGDSIVITVEFNPALLNTTGYYDARYKIMSSLCPDTLFIHSQADLVQPVLSVNPDTLDFGQVWMNDNSTKQVTITNSSARDITLDSLKLTNNEFTFTGNITLPKKMSMGDALTVGIRFTALKTGGFEDTLIVYSSSLCPSSDTVIIISNVPTEEYTARVYIPDYSFTPGEEVSLSMLVDSALPRVIPDSVYFRITFDKYLFFPHVITFVANGNTIDLPLDYNAGEINGFVTGIQANELFLKSGEIFRFKGLTLVSNPDTTPLTIAQFNISAKKTVHITKQDGSLSVSPVCKAISSLHLQLFSKPEIEAKTTSDGNISATISASSKYDGNLEVINLLGETAYAEDVTINAGRNSFVIPLMEYSSGLYIIRLRLKSGETVTTKVLKTN